MRTIQKGPEPATLTQHRQQRNADYNNYGDKPALREALVSEQRGLCCYCQSRIRATREGMKIEHWQCQANYPDQRLDFRNLLGVCRGNEGQSIDKQHCDTRKGNRDLCFSLCDPARPIEQQIRFLGDGRISSNEVAIDQAINRVLNLNLLRLVSNRRAVLAAFQQSLRAGRSVDPARELPKWDGSAPGELDEFAQVVVYWLRKKQARVVA